MDINSSFSPLTLICIGFILLVFVILLLYINRVSGNNTLIEKRRLINQFPSSISTLGVLFTFIGITVGLVGFDTSDLDSSIPLLLDGLKTAFVTSILGMLGSMVLSNIINSKFDNTDKGVSDINIAAGLITKSLSDMSSANIESLKLLLQQQEKQLKLVELIHNDNSEIINILSESSNSQYNEILLETNSILKELSATVVSIKDDFVAFKLSGANDLKSIQTTIKRISEDTANISSINDNVISSLKALGNLDASEQHVSEEIDKLGSVLKTEVSELNAVVKTQFSELSAFIDKINTKIADDILHKLELIENGGNRTNDILKGISEETDKMSSINENVISSLEALGNLDASEQHVSEEIDKLGLVLKTEVSELNAVVKTQFSELSAFIDKINTKIADDILHKLELIENGGNRTNDILKGISEETDKMSSINENVISSLEALGNLDASEQHVSEEIDKLGIKIGDNISTIVTKMNETNMLLTSKLEDVTNLLEKNDMEQLSLYMKKFASDFQNQMNALFNKLVSDNFKELNKSIEILCSWQQENKDMIKTLTSQYKQMADNFEDTSTALSDVEDCTRQLVDDGGKLSALILALNQVLLEDKNFVVAISRLKEAAEINKSNSITLNQSASNLNSWITSQKDFVSGVKKLVDKLDEISRFRDYNSAFWKDTKNKFNEGIDILNEGNEKMNNQIAEIDKHFYARLNTTLANLDACIQAMYNGKIK